MHLKRIELGDVVVTPFATYGGDDMVEVCIFRGYEGVLLLRVSQMVSGQMERYVKDTHDWEYSVRVIPKDQGLASININSSVTAQEDV